MHTGDKPKNIPSSSQKQVEKKGVRNFNEHEAKLWEAQQQQPPTNDGTKVTQKPRNFVNKLLANVQKQEFIPPTYPPSREVPQVSSESDKVLQAKRQELIEKPEFSKKSFQELNKRINSKTQLLSIQDHKITMQNQEIQIKENTLQRFISTMDTGISESFINIQKNQKLTWKGFQENLSANDKLYQKESKILEEKLQLMKAEIQESPQYNTTDSFKDYMKLFQRKLEHQEHSCDAKIGLYHEYIQNQNEIIDILNNIYTEKSKSKSMILQKDIQQKIDVIKTLAPSMDMETSESFRNAQSSLESSRSSFDKELKANDELYQQNSSEIETSLQEIETKLQDTPLNPPNKVKDHMDLLQKRSKFRQDFHEAQIGVYDSYIKDQEQSIDILSTMQDDLYKTESAMRQENIQRKIDTIQTLSPDMYDSYIKDQEQSRTLLSSIEYDLYKTKPNHESTIWQKDIQQKINTIQTLVPHTDVETSETLRNVQRSLESSRSSFHKELKTNSELYQQELSSIETRLQNAAVNTANECKGYIDLLQKRSELRQNFCEAQIDMYNNYINDQKQNINILNTMEDDLLNDTLERETASDDRSSVSSIESVVELEDKALQKQIALKEATLREEIEKAELSLKTMKNTGPEDIRDKIINNLQIHLKDAQDFFDNDKLEKKERENALISIDDNYETEIDLIDNEFKGTAEYEDKVFDLDQKVLNSKLELLTPHFEQLSQHVDALLDSNQKLSESLPPDKALGSRKHDLKSSEDVNNTKRVRFDQMTKDISSEEESSEEE